MDYKKAKDCKVAWKPKQKTAARHPTIEQYKIHQPYPLRIEGSLGWNNKYLRESESEGPLVSIVTVVRNGKATLERTICSVLNQTYKNIEYIIIDGNSDDETIEILQKYEHQITYWMSEPDRGISDAFNKGIAITNGKLVGMINADDWYSSNAIELAVEQYIYCENSIIHAKCQIWKKTMEPYYLFSGRDDISYTMTINHPTVFVPRKIYEEVGLFDLNYKISMDYEWIMRAKQYGKKFMYIDQVITNMRLGGVSNQLWLHFFEEIHVRHLYGMNLARNYFTFLNMLVTTLMRRCLEFLGLEGVVRLFRKHFSVTKKDIV